MTFGFKNHAVQTERWRYIRYGDDGEELYDHSRDPHEWTNLADDPSCTDEKEELRAMVLGQFDADAIDEEVQAGIRRRQLIREAMNMAKTRWDVSPQFDGRRPTLSQYLR